MSINIQKSVLKFLVLQKARAFFALSVVNLISIWGFSAALVQPNKKVKKELL
jgi:hypothetical protein